MCSTRFISITPTSSQTQIGVPSMGQIKLFNHLVRIIIRCSYFSVNDILSASSCRATRGARGVMVIVVGNGHGDSCSNPGRELLHFP